MAYEQKPAADLAMRWRRMLLTLFVKEFGKRARIRIQLREA